MDLDSKNYKALKTKNYLRKNDFLLFAMNANQNSQNWLTIEQGLYKLKLNYYKINNNTTLKIIRKSRYVNLTNIINSTFFFLKSTQSNKILTKRNLVNGLNSILFNLQTVALNKRLYSVKQLSNISLLSYKKNISLMYQFLITSITFSHTVVCTKKH